MNLWILWILSHQRPHCLFDFKACIGHIIMRFLNYYEFCHYSYIFMLLSCCWDKFSFDLIVPNLQNVWLFLSISIGGPIFLSCSWCILRLGFSESQNNFYKKIKWFCKSDVLIFLTNTISCFCVSLTLFISLSVSLSLPCLCCYLCVCMCMWICTHTQTSVYVINISLKLFITVSLGFILTPKMYNWLHNYFNTLCG